jgi:hypothetical protein
MRRLRGHLIVGIQAGARAALAAQPTVSASRIAPRQDSKLRHRLRKPALCLGLSTSENANDHRVFAFSRLARAAPSSIVPFPETPGGLRVALPFEMSSSRGSLICQGPTTASSNRILSWLWAINAGSEQDPLMGG